MPYIALFLEKKL